MTVTIIYETHSTTTDNENGIATGWLPGTLSDAGRRQAAELGARRGQDDISVVYSSDLARAIETAQIAFGDSDIEIRHEERLRECNYGTYNGAPTATLHPLRRLHVEQPFPDGESYRDVVRRTHRLLDDLAAEHAGETVMFIGHSANRWALDVLLKGAELSEAVRPGPFDWQPGWNYTLQTRPEGSAS